MALDRPTDSSHPSRALPPTGGTSADPVIDAPREPGDPPPDGSTASSARREDPLAVLRVAAAAPSPTWSSAWRSSRASRVVARLLERLRGVFEPGEPATEAPAPRTRRATAAMAVSAVVLVAAVVVVVVGVVVIGAPVVWRWAGSGPPAMGGADVAASLPRASSDASGTGDGGGGSTAATGPGAAGVGAELVVQVAGAVVQPGVYRLEAGARVGDLVTRAGGFAPDADGDRVNLAAPLADGVRVWVPRRGEAEPPPLIDTGPSGVSGTGTGTAAPLVDLNTATEAELEELPGVGPTTAAAIIEHRQRNGPFRSVDELADVRGIGDAKLAQLRDRVRV